MAYVKWFDVYVPNCIEIYEVSAFLMYDFGCPLLELLTFVDRKGKVWDYYDIVEKYMPKTRAFNLIMGDYEAKEVQGLL